MSSLRFGYTPPEVIEQFRQIVRTALEREGKLSPALRQRLEQTARELGILRVDMERVLQEVMALPSVQATIARHEAAQGPQVQRQTGEVRYTETHEWVRWERDVLVCGISDYAESVLSDIIYVELPQVGAVFARGDTFGVIESVKAIGDLYMPMGGKIVAINEALIDQPELINRDPYGNGWMIRFRPTDPAEFDTLMEASAYKALIASLE
jgi:glycine cleavage system H protein